MFAAQRRRALQKLDVARHEVLTRGPEGESKSWDEKGKRIRAGQARTEYVGYREYTRELMAEAGLIDPDIERMVDEMRRNNAFWGEMPAIVSQQDG